LHGDLFFLLLAVDQQGVVPDTVLYFVDIAGGWVIQVRWMVFAAIPVDLPRQRHSVVVNGMEQCQSFPLPCEQVPLVGGIFNSDDGEAVGPGGGLEAGVEAWAGRRRERQVENGDQEKRNPVVQRRVCMGIKKSPLYYNGLF
jgi:hypothetical protein